MSKALEKTKEVACEAVEKVKDIGKSIKDVVVEGYRDIVSDDMPSGRPEKRLDANYIIHDHPSLNNDRIDENYANVARGDDILIVDSDGIPVRIAEGANLNDYGERRVEH